MRRSAMLRWFSPATRPEGTSPSRRPTGGRAAPETLALLRDPLRDLPPTLVCVGEAEIPRDDILAFAEQLREARVDCTVHVAPDIPHNPALFAAYHPAGKAAFEAAAEFVSRAAKRADVAVTASSA